MTRIDTVFSPSFGNRPSTLVGRDQAIQEFTAGLESAPGSRQRAMLVLGQRGQGKTVLLWEYAELAEAHGFVVASPTVAGENLLQRVIEKIQDKGESLIKERKVRIQGGSLGALGFSAGLQFTPEVQETKSFQYKLAKLCDRLEEKGHGVVILVDEVQANKPQVRQLVSAYQEMVGERKNVALVMAGLPSAIAETLNDSVLTFLNRAYRVELGPLPATDLDFFLKRSFASLGLMVDDDIRAQAVEAIQGSPYLMQLVGHNMVLAADNDGVVTQDAFRRARDAALKDFQRDVCLTTLKQLSDVDVHFLTAMAADPTDSKMADIAERMGVSADYAQKYRRRLLEAGIIATSRRGYVRFDVPFLADYLRTLE